MMFCDVCKAERDEPAHKTGATCTKCAGVRQAFDACEHSLHVPDRFSASDREHMNHLERTNPVALGTMFHRAFEACLRFGKTIPWNEATEQKAIEALARDLFLTMWAPDPGQAKLVYDAITWPDGMGPPGPGKLIPFYSQKPEPDCDECKGTGWYVGLIERTRCRTCL